MLPGASNPAGAMLKGENFCGRALTTAAGPAAGTMTVCSKYSVGTGICLARRAGRLVPLIKVVFRTKSVSYTHLTLPTTPYV